MFGWFKRAKPPAAPPPLRGAPEVRRLKTYQAETGFVYQYYFDGWRPIDGAREFIFVASPDRARYSAIAVHIDNAAVYHWEAVRGRELLSAEQHAVAKLALFAALDERAPAAAGATPVRVGPAQLKDILKQLGRD